MNGLRRNDDTMKYKSRYPTKPYKIKKAASFETALQCFLNLDIELIHFARNHTLALHFQRFVV